LETFLPAQAKIRVCFTLGGVSVGRLACVVGGGVEFPASGEALVRRWTLHFTARVLPDLSRRHPALAALSTDLAGWIDQGNVPDGTPFLLGAIVNTCG
jgi:hypothetical protein